MFSFGVETLKSNLHRNSNCFAVKGKNRGSYAKNKASYQDLSWKHMERKTSLGPDHSWHYHRDCCSSCKLSLLGKALMFILQDEINAQGSNFIIIYSQEPNLFYTNELQIIDKTPGIAAVSPIKQQLGVGNLLLPEEKY